MVNADYRWVYNQQLFQNAIKGEDVKDRLINCLNMLYHSHNENMGRNEAMNGPIINWNPENPDGTLNPPPIGWELVDDTWVFRGLQQEGGETNAG